MIRIICAFIFLLQSVELNAADREEQKISEENKERAHDIVLLTDLSSIFMAALEDLYELIYYPASETNFEDLIIIKNPLYQEEQYYNTVIITSVL